MCVSGVEVLPDPLIDCEYPECPLSSCEGHCGQGFEDCSCDPVCSIFMDCCPDFEILCTSPGTTSHTDSSQALGIDLEMQMEGAQSDSNVDESGTSAIDNFSGLDDEKVGEADHEDKGSEGNVLGTGEDFSNSSHSVPVVSNTLGITGASCDNKCGLKLEICSCDELCEVRGLRLSMRVGNIRPSHKLMDRHLLLICL